MNGNLSEAVVLLVPVFGVIGLFLFLTVVGFAKERRRERQSLYRHETARKLLEAGKLEHAQFEALLEDERRTPARERQKMLVICGIVLATAGLGVMTLFLIQSGETSPLTGESYGSNDWAIGLVPMLIGLGLFLAAFVAGPDRRK